MATKGPDNKSESLLVTSTMPIGTRQISVNESIPHLWSVLHLDPWAGQKELICSHWSVISFTSSYDCNFNDNWQFYRLLTKITQRINQYSDLVVLKIFRSCTTLINWENCGPFSQINAYNLSGEQLEIFWEIFSKCRISWNRNLKCFRLIPSWWKSSFTILWYDGLLPRGLQNLDEVGSYWPDIFSVFTSIFFSPRAWHLH